MPMGRPFKTTRNASATLKTATALGFTWLTAAGCGPQRARDSAQDAPAGHGVRTGAPADVLADVAVPSAEGQDSHPLRNASARATCMIFVLTDCPISNAYAPELARIFDDYARMNIAFALVYVDAGTTAMQACAHAQEYNLRAQVLLDGAHALARAVGATVTPEAAVVSPAGELLYLGRIDDLYQDYGQRRFTASQRDLRAALDAIIHGRPVPAARTRAIGCDIPQ